MMLPSHIVRDVERFDAASVVAVIVIVSVRPRPGQA